MSSKQVVEFETVRVHKDGHEMNLEIVLSLVKKDSGDVVGVSTIARDITERKRRELNTAFLDEIGKELSVLPTPDEIIQTVGVRLSEFMKASGYIFADVDEAKNEATIHHGWNTADVASLK
ncbi:MAG: hypothetical protein C4332_09175 [Meiothermus sp.]